MPYQLSSRERLFIACHRLRALAVNGWSTEDLAERLEVSKNVVTRVRKFRGSMCSRALYEQIEELYVRLHLQINDSVGGKRTAALARKQGWHFAAETVEDLLDRLAA